MRVTSVSGVEIYTAAMGKEEGLGEVNSIHLQRRFVVEEIAEAGHVIAHYLVHGIAAAAWRRRGQVEVLAAG